MSKRARLLGNGLLGSGGLNQPRPRPWLINDDFTTSRAVGAVNGTFAEPGPSQRLVVDTLAKLSITGGALSFATGGAANDPQLRHRPGVGRVGGRVMTADFTITAYGFETGWDSGLAGSSDDGIRMTSSTLNVRVNSGTVLGVAANALSTAYRVAIILRTAGAFYFIKGGAFTNWTLLWISTAGTYASAYPMVSVTGATAVVTADRVRVARARWLPAPLLSDGFSTFATSALTAVDGRGHAEGVAGGLGSGGAGQWPYNQVGTWQASGGVASASALSGGVALAYMDVGALDLIATVKITWVGGTAGLIVRGDANDHVRAVHTGTNAQLVKRVASVDTTLIDAVATYVAGAEIRVIAQGNAFRLFYNGAAVGSEQTIADASLNANGYAGLRTTDTGNTFDDLVVRARGTGGEYSALDAF